MKVLASRMLVILWCMTMMVVLLSINSVTSTADECNQVNQHLSYSTVSFDLSIGFALKCYPKFLTRLRNQVQAPTRACGYPTTRNDPLRGHEYLTVDLKISNRQWVSLGIDVKDLYIWGFQDKYNGSLRANFVLDVPEAARANLFPDSTITRTTTFKGNYIELQRRAQINRKQQKLSIESLSNAIIQVYGKPESQLNNAEEAKFYMLAIQMVSEAARFKFIEDGIVKSNETDDFKRKIVGFVNDWDKISSAIHRAEAQPINKCTVFDPAIVVGNVDYTITVSNLNEIRDDMALLKYKSNRTIRPTNKLDRAFLESDAAVM